MKRTIVYATDLDHMIDLVQAWREGKFEAVREAIQSKGQTDMTDKKYDDSNEVALWTRDDNAKGVYEGYGKLNGERVHRAYLISRKNRTESGPLADLFLSLDSGTHAIPVWRKDNGRLAGSIGDDYWVNVWKRDEGASEKAPAYKAKFQVKEPATASATASADDEVPF